MDKIKELRIEIDSIDNQIMDLLDKRFEIAKEIGVIKSVIERDVFDPYREQNILDKTTKFSHFPQIKAIYQTIMEQSKSLQRK